jgi:hypothetical protein
MNGWGDTESMKAMGIGVSANTSWLTNHCKRALTKEHLVEKKHSTSPMTTRSGKKRYASPPSHLSESDDDTTLPVAVVPKKRARIRRPFPKFRFHDDKLDDEQDDELDDEPDDEPGDEPDNRGDDFTILNTAPLTPAEPSELNVVSDGSSELNIVSDGSPTPTLRLSPPIVDAGSTSNDELTRSPTPQQAIRLPNPQYSRSSDSEVDTSIPDPWLNVQTKFTF